MSARLYVDAGQCVDLELGRHSLLEEALQDCEREEPAVPAPPVKARLLSGRLRLALVSVLSVATIFASGMFLNGNRSRPEQFGLKAERHGNSLFVNWNRRDPRILHARDAAFRNGDGAEVRTLEFSGAELRSGGLLYEPRNEEIRFTLEVQRA